MDRLIQDIRYALRQLANAPAFTVTAILTLALGIGANTAIYSLLDQVMLRSLPVLDHERLVMVQHTGSDRGRVNVYGGDMGDYYSYPTLQTSFNVSPASTTDPDWWAGLGSLLRKHTGIAERLIVEITESAAIEDIDETRGFVARVKDIGCRIAIDDFGAGYTSFRNLRKLGVDIVKIDGAFVRNITHSEDDRAFVRTLIDLAKRLKLETVAEWVQDDAAAETLQAWGCDYLQGALVGLAATERPWLATVAKAV